MTRPYRLSTRAPIPTTHALHWQNFWPDLQRLHRSTAEARQDLVLWIANLYHGAIRCGLPIGFCSVQVRLMDLRDWVRDYQPALEHFFEIKQRGYHVNDEVHDLTTLVPKRLPKYESKQIDNVVEQLRYDPPPLPTESTISKVYLQAGLDHDALVKKLLERGRPELVPQLSWLLRQPNEINFHFQRSGKLKLRDTSVWPIAGIENWPGWLREELFGPGIDLDSAYVQFLLQTLKKVFVGREHMVQMLFPDLFRMLHEKEAFREEMCTQVLGIAWNEKNRGLVKAVLMSLANGSRISPRTLTSGSGFSSTNEMIIAAAQEATTMDLTVIGRRLQRIGEQFTSAKKHVCVYMQKTYPTRANVKKVFGSYFAWERLARYALWEEVGRHGIMVHDGLDGVPQEHLDRLDDVMETLGLRLTA